MREDERFYILQGRGAKYSRLCKITPDRQKYSSGVYIFYLKQEGIFMNPQSQRIQRIQKIQNLTMIAMLAALAYLVMAWAKMLPPLVPMPPLKYDPKDVFIIIGGFLYGPLAAAAMSIIVSLIEMVTLSTTGPIGFIMNVVSSCSFAITAAVIYKYRRTLSGAVAGLVCGVILTAFMMVLWNYLVTPLYMGFPRSVVTPYLMPFFLPFNLIKGGINAAATIIIYKPATKILRQLSGTSISEEQKGKLNVAVVAVAAAVIIICAAIALLLNN